MDPVPDTVAETNCDTGSYSCQSTEKPAGQLQTQRVKKAFPYEKRFFCQYTENPVKGGKVQYWQGCCFGRQYIDQAQKKNDSAVERRFRLVNLPEAGKKQGCEEEKNCYNEQKKKCCGKPGKFCNRMLCCIRPDQVGCKSYCDCKRKN